MTTVFMVRVSFGESIVPNRRHPLPAATQPQALRTTPAGVKNLLITYTSISYESF